MTTPSDVPEQPPVEPAARDAAYWAKPIARFDITAVPDGALSLNVKGRRAVGALQGFGQMWQKTYRVRLTGSDATPAEVIKTWKERFPEFWPAGNRFYGPLTGIAPGEVALINLAPMPGPMKLSTGIRVIYADDESFTFMNPEGHMFAGWITFSAFQQDGTTVAQAQVLVRASDPAWEIVMRLFAYRKEDQFWHHTLRALAAHFGVVADVEQQAICVDRKLQWSHAGNIWHNAAMWSGLYVMAAPLRWMARPFRRTPRPHPPA